MSFSDEFQFRWEKVILPAISRISKDGVELKAHRVDVKKVSGSILTEILTGISQSLLVLADISTIGKIDDSAIRNANVLYEVGLAQAVRLPEEVLLFRSDRDPLLFDVSNIRVNFYDPDNEVEQSQKKLIEAMEAAFGEIDQKKQLTVQRFAKTLDYPSWWTLALAAFQNGLSHPVQKSIGQILGSFSQSQAINRLLEIGALTSKFQKLTTEILEKNIDNDRGELLMQYDITPLGTAILKHTGEEMGLMEPAISNYFEKKIKEGGHLPFTPNKPES